MTDLTDLREAKLRLMTAESTKAEAEVASLTELTRKIRLEADAAYLNLLSAQRQEDDRAASTHLSREYHFFSSVNGSSVEMCIDSLGHWSRRDPGKEMTIIFNTPGGSVFDGLALFDYIQGLRRKGHHITTKAIGTAASMGGILLQAGDVRVMDTNSLLLIHEVSAGMVGGKTSEVEDFQKLMQRLERRVLGILAERSTMSTAQIRTKWKKTDWWLDADEALKLGFADAVE
jgi:ATP-dependent Clp protease protease subunit